MFLWLYLFTFHKSNNIFCRRKKYICIHILWHLTIHLLRHSIFNSFFCLRNKVHHEYYTKTCVLLSQRKRELLWKLILLSPLFSLSIYLLYQIFYKYVIIVFNISQKWSLLLKDVDCIPTMRFKISLCHRYHYIYV